MSNRSKACHFLRNGQILPILGLLVELYPVERHWMLWADFAVPSLVEWVGPLSVRSFQTKRVWVCIDQLQCIFWCFVARDRRNQCQAVHTCFRPRARRKNPPLCDWKRCRWQTSPVSFARRQSQGQTCNFLVWCWYFPRQRGARRGAILAFWWQRQFPRDWIRDAGETVLRVWIDLLPLAVVLAG